MTTIDLTAQHVMTEIQKGIKGIPDDIKGVKEDLGKMDTRDKVKLAAGIVGASLLSVALYCIMPERRDD